MKEQIFAIIEIGSNNTKTHIYKNGQVIQESTDTIEFKKNYNRDHRLNIKDIEKLYGVIECALNNTAMVYIFGCSIFRTLSQQELIEVNRLLEDKFHLSIRVVSQEEEALLTAYGCYSSIAYSGSICVFIGGGGSTELIFINNGEVIGQQYFDFGVVDITKAYESLKNDVPTCNFEEVYTYVDTLLGSLEFSCDLLILAGGDHLYWYRNANYELEKNSLYHSEKQPHMIPIEMSDHYDHDAFIISLDRIRRNSDNPLWFDGSRAMKVLTNVISHKISAKYLIPTNINMEVGLSKKIMDGKISFEGTGR